MFGHITNAISECDDDYTGINIYKVVIMLPIKIHNSYKAGSGLFVRIHILKTVFFVYCKITTHNMVLTLSLKNFFQTVALSFTLVQQ